LKYNSDTVLLCDLPTCRNFSSGEKISLPILVSNYGEKLTDAELNIRVNMDGKVIFRQKKLVDNIPNGEITSLLTEELPLPEVTKPKKLLITAALSAGNTDVENSWEIYLFPNVAEADASSLTVTDNISTEELIKKMKNGERVVLLGTGPFASVKTRFQLSVAGRTNGHLATVIADHSLLSDLPHDGYCGWQFRKMLDSSAAIVDVKRLPHEPIIDIASSYKNAKREAMLFEYKVGEGRLIVCTLNLSGSDPFAAWLKNKIVSYASTSAFEPKQSITLTELSALCSGEKTVENENENMAQNKNDITMN